MASPLVPFVTREASHAMVSTVDHLATSAGVAALRRGGSAADAAVAANAVLAVTAPHLCGMGGDLFALVYAGDGPPAVLNASGRAGSGAAAAVAALRRESHRSVPLRLDPRAVTVPGCVDGWLELHERHGRLPLGDVLADAVRYAVDGFPASPLLARAVPALAGCAGAEDLTDRGPHRAGDVVRRPGVGRALLDVAAGGRDGFYGGAFGEGLLALCGGLLDAGDLARSQAAWVAPLGLRVWDHDVWTVPPNSQGYLTLAGAWIAEGLPLPDDPDDAAWAHLLVEAARQAGHDRPAVLHDGADGAALVAAERLAPRRAAVDTRRAGSLTVPGAPGGTTYLCAVDGDGLGVSLIQSNASGFGSHLFEPTTGIGLHNRGLGFSLEEGHPARYAPGRRPPHTLSPALVTRPDGTLALLVGTMGGDAQPQIVLQLLARLLAAGEAPGPAVAAGRWALAAPGGTGFDTWTGGVQVVEIEGHAPEGWAPGLERRGHRVRLLHAFEHTFGHAHVIRVGVHGTLSGAADPRALVGDCTGW